MRKILKFLLFLFGVMMISIAIYGAVYFVIDLKKMYVAYEQSPEIAAWNEVLRPRRQFYIVGLVDSIEHFSIGLLCLFAAFKIGDKK